MEIYESEFCIFRNQIQYLLQQITVSQSQASLTLDYYENKNWSMTSLLNIVLMFMILGIFFAGLFTMNTDSSDIIAPIRGMFTYVTITITLIIIVGSMFGYMFLVESHVLDSENKGLIKKCLS